MNDGKPDPLQDLFELCLHARQQAVLAEGEREAAWSEYGDMIEAAVAEIERLREIERRATEMVRTHDAYVAYDGKRDALELRLGFECSAAYNDLTRAIRDRTPCAS